MTRQVDEFLLHEMEREDVADTIHSCVDGTDEIIEAMMETESKNEVSDRVFPVAEKYQETIDPETLRIAESLCKDEYSCECGELVGEKNEGCTCKSCCKKVTNGGKKHASN